MIFQSISTLISLYRMIMEIYNLLKGVIKHGKEKSEQKKRETFEQSVNEISELAKIQNPDERIAKRKDELKKIIDSMQ